LIGEANVTNEDILDSLAEFVNIIGGRAKILLSENKKHLNITLPRTYADVKTLLEIAQDKKGVQVDLNFEGQNFIFFLTR
ncbi:MAG: chemotaxis protein CheX, partial [Sulfuricurvum sp.]|nr:chemotaxis protein CheX [Sulfuricurvum sp.]